MGFWNKLISLVKGSPKKKKGAGLVYKSGSYAKDEQYTNLDSGTKPRSNDNVNSGLRGKVKGGIRPIRDVKAYKPYDDYKSLHERRLEEWEKRKKVAYRGGAILGKVSGQKKIRNGMTLQVNGKSLILDTPKSKSQ